MFSEHIKYAFATGIALQLVTYFFTLPSRDVRKQHENLFKLIFWRMSKERELQHVFNPKN